VTCKLFTLFSYSIYYYNFKLEKYFTHSYYGHVRVFDTNLKFSHLPRPAQDAPNVAAAEEALEESSTHDE